MVCEWCNKTVQEPCKTVADYASCRYASVSERYKAVTGDKDKDKTSNPNRNVDNDVKSGKR